MTNGSNLTVEIKYISIMKDKTGIARPLLMQCYPFLFTGFYADSLIANLNSFNVVSSSFLLSVSA